MKLPLTSSRSPSATSIKPHPMATSLKVPGLGTVRVGQSMDSVLPRTARLVEQSVDEYEDVSGKRIHRVSRRYDLNGDAKPDLRVQDLTEVESKKSLGRRYGGSQGTVGFAISDQTSSGRVGQIYTIDTKDQSSHGIWDRNGDGKADWEVREAGGFERHLRDIDFNGSVDEETIRRVKP